MSVKQHVYTDGKEWVGFPLLSNYRFPVKSVSLDCCALLNSWSIAECPPHLWVVGHCELIYLQDSITSLRTQHWRQGASPMSVSPVLLWTRISSHSPLSPTLWKQQRKDAYYPRLMSFPRSRYFLFPPSSPLAFSLFEGELSSGSIILQNLILLLGSWGYFTQIILLVTYWLWD